MLQNYFKIALRNLRRHKGYAFINIVGLAVGLAACLIILAYVQFETSFDRFHAEADRIYRLEMEVSGRTGREHWSASFQPLGSILRDDPAVVSVTQVSGMEEALVRTDEKQLYESYFRYADASFFDVFSFEIIRGSKASLDQPGTIFLSESTATRYFGDEDPVGQAMEVSFQWSREVETYKIVGIMADTPANAHFRVDFLASFATSLVGVEDPWSRLSHTYLMLDEGRTENDLIASFRDIEITHLEARSGGNRTLSAIPLTRIHLYSEARGDIEPQGDAMYVYLFSLIALLIVVLACINYMNLATARSSMRAREVGVRKVVGAGRKQLIYQFLGESFLFVGLGLLAAIALAQFSLPVFNAIMGRSVELELGDRALVFSVIGGSIIVALLAGSYPAFLLSSFAPSSVLKGPVRTHTWPLLRKGLVVFQFAVSIGFIAATIIIYRQLNFVQNQRIGFDREQKMVMSTRGQLGNQAGAFKQELLNQLAVGSVTMSSSLPGRLSVISFFEAGDIEGYDGDPDDLRAFDHFFVDHDFIDVLGLEIKEGRAFSRAFSTDEAESILINETAAKIIGWDDPLGKRINVRQGVQKKVIGIVNDFQVKTMRQMIEPLIIELGNQSTFITMSIAPQDFAETRASFEALWSRFIPDLPFAYSFLEDDIEAMYRAERRMGQLFVIFAGLAVVVASLGLFGLAAFTTLQRTKEIGIRKTLGASTAILVRLLSQDYIRLLAIAFVVAIPVAYLGMRSWLDGFAYRIEMDWWIFAAAGALALVIAVATVSYQSIRAALANPVEALRYE